MYDITSTPHNSDYREKSTGYRSIWRQILELIDLEGNLGNSFQETDGSLARRSHPVSETGLNSQTPERLDFGKKRMLLDCEIKLL